jgi:hypothetical protein
MGNTASKWRNWRQLRQERGAGVRRLARKEAAAEPVATPGYKLQYPYIWQPPSPAEQAAARAQQELERARIRQQGDSRRRAEREQRKREKEEARQQMIAERVKATRERDQERLRVKEENRRKREEERARVIAERVAATAKRDADRLELRMARFAESEAKRFAKAAARAARREEADRLSEEAKQKGIALRKLIREQRENAVYEASHLREVLSSLEPAEGKPSPAPNNITFDLTADEYEKLEETPRLPCLIVEDVDEIERIIEEELGPVEDAPFMRRKLHVLT